MSGVTVMKIGHLMSVLLVCAGCATSQPAQEIEAVRDFVAANELEEFDKVRYHGDLRYKYVNDRYVTVTGRGGPYLVEFRRDCRELRFREFTPEMVDRPIDKNTLNARFDTIRGCRIGTIYGLTPEQLEELRNLGDAPGDEVFLPDEETG
jgi:hypothetical protein